MNKAEVWLGERMTVRRWLMAIGGVGVFAAAVGFCALAAVRPDDPSADAAATPAALPGSSPAEQVPASVCLTVNVGPLILYDARAAVTLEMFPTHQPPDWRVAVRTQPATPTGPVREVDLAGPDVHKFVDALDDAVRRHDPDDDRTVGGTTIHAVEVAPGDYRYDLRCVGVMRLDADAVAEMRRMLTKADANRLWLAPRTVPLRMATLPPAASASVPPPPARPRSPG